MKHFVLALFLLTALACARQPAPSPVPAEPPLLPHFEPLAGLYDDFQTFKNDRLYLRHGFTANFPRADWLDRVQRLENSPELAEGARLLAHIAVAHRIHGAKSRVTKGFEARFRNLLRPAPEPLPPIPQNATGVAETTAPENTDAPEASLPPAAQAQNAPAAPDTATSDGQGAVEHENESPALNAADAANTSEPDEVITRRNEAEPPMTTAALTQDAINATDATAPEGPDARQEKSEPATPESTQSRNSTVPATATAPDGTVAPPAAQEPSAQQAAQPDAPPVRPNPVAPPKTPHALTVLFSGDNQGVVYPQPGLSGAVGGISRRGPVIEHMRDRTPDLMLLDAGDAFTSGFPKAERINKTLVRAMNRMGYDAMGLGRHDLAMGEVALRELVSIASFDVVCTNLRFSQGFEPWIRDHVILTRAGVRVAVISLLPPDADFRITGADLLPSALALGEILPKLADRADCVVLLTQMDNAQLAALPGLHAAVSAVIGDFQGKSGGNPPYSPTLPKGLGIGLLRLERTDQGPFRPTETLPLVSGTTEDPNLVRLLEELRN
jgi:hypothetical protein